MGLKSTTRLGSFLEIEEFGNAGKFSDLKSSSMLSEVFIIENFSKTLENF